VKEVKCYKYGNGVKILKVKQEIEKYKETRNVKES